MPVTSVFSRYKVDIEVALTAAVFLTAVNSPLRLTLVVSVILLLLSALCSTFSQSTFSSWTQTYLNALVLLGVFAFSWVLFVSHGSIAARLLIISGGLLALGVVLIALGRETLEQPASVESDSGRLPTELLVPAMAAVLLSVRGFFPLSITAVAIVVGAFITRRRTSLRTIAPVVGLCGWAVWFSRSWFEREPYWFFVSYDQQFRASLATGLTRWGYTDLNSATGTSISYHWLAEAISGVFSRLAGVDEFIVVTQAAPVLGFLGAVSAMWRVVQTLGLRGGAALFGVTVPSLVLLEMDPFSIGTLWGVAFTCYLVELAIRGQSDSIRMSAIIVVSTIALMTQTPFGLTATIALLMTTLLDLKASWTSWNSLIRIATRALVVVTPLLALRLTVLRPGTTPMSAGSLGFNNFLQFGGFNVAFGIDSESPAWLTMLNSLGYLLEILLIAVPLLLVHYDRHQRLTPASKPTLRYLLALLVVSVAVINLLDLSVAQGKLMSAVLVSWMPISAAFTWSMTRYFSRVSMVLLGVVLGSCLARIYFLARNVEPDYLAAALSMLLLALGGGAIVVAYRVLETSFSKFENCRQGKAKIAAAASLVLVVAVSFGRPERVPVTFSRQPIEQRAIEGSPELRSCLEWVRVNTTTDSVIATDFFDPEGLSGRGKSHLVSLATKRRVLLDGLYMKIDDQKLINQRTLRASSLQDTLLPIDFYVVSSELASSSVTSGLTVKLANSTCVVLRTELR